MFAILAGVAVASLTSCATPQDSQETRIIALGDLHGDYSALEQFLDAAELLDEDGDWAAGETILIQTGDVSDRGPDTRQIIALLRELQAEAEAVGGQVIVLSGNHEALNMIGDFRYVDDGEIEAFVDENSEARREAYFQENLDAIMKRLVDDGIGEEGLTEDDARELFFARFPLGFDEYREAWSPEGIHGDWVDELPAVAILGDTLFVHGGLSAPYASYTVEELNEATALAMTAQTQDRSAIINDQLGPHWYRGLHRAPGEVVHFAGLGPLTIEEELDLILESFGVNRIVVGHTPSLEGIVTAHDDRVIRIDTGMSAYYGGVISFLEITEDGIFAYSDGRREQIGSD